MKIVVKSTKTISFDENFDDDGSSSENKSQDSNKDSEDSKHEPLNDAEQTNGNQESIKAERISNN